MRPCTRSRLRTLETQNKIKKYYENVALYEQISFRFVFGFLTCVKDLAYFFLIFFRYRVSCVLVPMPVIIY
jgi:hypothetical protein